MSKIYRQTPYVLWKLFKHDKQQRVNYVLCQQEDSLTQSVCLLPSQQLLPLKVVFVISPLPSTVALYSTWKLEAQGSLKSFSSSQVWLNIENSALHDIVASTKPCQIGIIVHVINYCIRAQKLVVKGAGAIMHACPTTQRVHCTKKVDTVKSGFFERHCFRHSTLTHLSSC